jgi:hypothetical protein
MTVFEAWGIESELSGLRPCVFDTKREAQAEVRWCRKTFGKITRGLWRVVKIRVRLEMANYYKPW